jgi:hypothetical protein
VCAVCNVYTVRGTCAFSIQLRLCKLLESFGSIPLCIDTIRDPLHIVGRIPSQHAKLRISMYIITSKSTRYKGHDNPSTVNLILRISYSNSQFYEEHQADST